MRRIEPKGGENLENIGTSIPYFHHGRSLAGISDRKSACERRQTKIKTR